MVKRIATILALLGTATSARVAWSQPKAGSLRPRRLAVPKKLQPDFHRASSLTKEGKLELAGQIYKAIANSREAKGAVRAEAQMLRVRTILQLNKRQPTPDDYRGIIRDGSTWQSSWAVQKLGQTYLQNNQPRKVIGEFGKLPITKLGRKGAHVLATAYMKESDKAQALNTYLKIVAYEPEDTVAVNACYKLWGEQAGIVDAKATDVARLSHQLIGIGKYRLVERNVLDLLSKKNQWTSNPKNAQQLLAILIGGVSAKAEGRRPGTAKLQRFRGEVNGKVAAQFKGKRKPAYLNDVQKILDGKFPLRVNGRLIDRRSAVRAYPSWSGDAAYKAALASLLTQTGYHFRWNDDPKVRDADKALAAFYTAWLLDERKTEAAVQTAELLRVLNDRAGTQKAIHQSFVEDLRLRKPDRALAWAHTVLGDWANQNSRREDTLTHWKQAASIQANTGDHKTAPALYERLALVAAAGQNRERAVRFARLAADGFRKHRSLRRAATGDLLAFSLGAKENTGNLELLGGAFRTGPFSLKTVTDLIPGPPGFVVVTDGAARAIYVVQAPSVSRRSDAKSWEFTADLGVKDATILAAAFEPRTGQLLLAGACRSSREAKTVRFLYAIQGRTGRVAKKLVDDGQAAENLRWAKFPLRPALLPTSPKVRRSSLVRTAYAAGHLIVAQGVVPEPGRSGFYRSQVEVISLLSGERQPPKQVSFFHPGKPARSVGPLSAAHYRFQGRSHLLVAYAGAPLIEIPLWKSLGPSTTVQARTFAQLGDSFNPRSLLVSSKGKAWISSQASKPDDAQDGLWAVHLNDPDKLRPITKRTAERQGPIEGRFRASHIRAAVMLNDTHALVITQDGRGKPVRVKAVRLP
jgi:tetratricopeptide (TPR) repeat protein